MLFMLIDHVRERIYLHMQVADPMSVEDTSIDLFFTRLLAHICAPVFVFLTGVSAWLYSDSNKKESSLISNFLLKRGLFLIAMEVTLINFSWMGEYHTLWLQVIWAIGISMIVLSLMVKLPMWAIASTGFLIVFGHNLLSPINFEPGDVGYVIWTILHDRAYLVSDGVLKVRASYPVLPWIGVILLGYFSGQLYDRGINTQKRTKLLVKIGVSCLVLLLILRGTNLYGEPVLWISGNTKLVTVMSFFNFTKYPPSLHFLLMNLGIGILLLAWFERIHSSNKVLKILRTFGSAPMFFYVVHLYALLLIYWVLIAIYGANQGNLFGVDNFVWVWILSVTLSVVLYFPTKAFSEFKKGSNQAWLRYF